MAEEDGHDHVYDLLLTPAEEIAELALDESEWETLLQEIRGREAAGPAGCESATIKDGVVLLQRCDD